MYYNASKQDFSIFISLSKLETRILKHLNFMFQIFEMNGFEKEIVYLVLFVGRMSRYICHIKFLTAKNFL